MSWSNRTENAVLASLFGKTSAFGALASRPTIHLGLSTTAPAEDGTNVTEPDGEDGYERVETEPADWGDPSGGEIANVADLTFPRATGDWGEVGWVVAYDAGTGGNLLAAAPLAVAKVVGEGDQLQLLIGNAKFTVD